MISSSMLLSMFHCFSLDLWSGLDDNGERKTSVAGLASVGGACLSSPVSINEYTSSTTLAHELGHKYV